MTSDTDDTDTLEVAVLVASYAAMLAIANVAAVKIVSFGGWEFTAGVIPIAAAYLISDIGVERHGREFGHRLVWGGFAALALVVVMSQSVVALPGESPVNEVLGFSLPTLLASLSAIVVGQHADVWLFTAIKDRLPYRPTRNIGSTVLSQLIDTALFTVLAFAVYPAILGGIELPLSAILSVVVTEWVIKSGIAVVDTPVFLVATDEP